MTTSRVLRFHEYGEPLDVLRREEVDVTGPPPGMIRVQVGAVGLNPADWELCRGFMAGDLPRGIGFDVAGTVDAVGEGVDESAAVVGDVVLGSADFVGQPSAGAADLAVLDHWTRVPEGLDMVQAASLPMIVETAALALDAMAPAPGSTLLVHGAGGMVGYVAVQLALQRGVDVVATAGPTFGPDLEGFGARVTGHGDGMVERLAELTADRGIDLVLDASRPAPGTVRDLVAVAGGEPRRVVTISNHDEAHALGARSNLDEVRLDLADLDALLGRYAEMAARGDLSVPVARTFALDDWRDAVRLSVEGSPHGKVLLQP